MMVETKIGYWKRKSNEMVVRDAQAVVQALEKLV